MRLAYDLDADALYATLDSGTVARTVAVDDSTNVDLAEDGRLLGIEVIHPDRPWPLERIIDEYEMREAHAAGLRAVVAARWQAPTLEVAR